MFSKHHNSNAIISCTRTSEVAQREIQRPKLSVEERDARIRRYMVRAASGQDLFNEVQKRSVA